MAADGSVIVDTRMDNNGLIQGSRRFSQMINSMKNTVNQVGRDVSSSAKAYIQSLNQSTAAAKILDAEIKRLESQATKLKRSMTGDKAFTTQYNALTNQIKEAETEIEKLQAKQQEWNDIGIDPESAPFVELDNQIFDLIDRIDELKAKQAELMESGGAYTPEYANMQQDLTELQEELAQLKVIRDEALSTPPGWNEMATVTGAVADAMNRLKTSATTLLYAIQHPAESIDRLFSVVITKGVTSFIQLSAAATRAGASIVRIAGGGALSFFKKLAGWAKNAAIQLAKLMGNAAGNGFRMLGNGIGNAVKGLFRFDRSSKAAGIGIKQLLSSMLGARAIISSFKKLIGIAKESLEELANSNPKVKLSLDSLNNALNGLKSSLGTAFAPIFTAVAPAITRLINMLTSAINTIGAFIAALTGQRTYSKAVAGLESTGSAASGAADDVKELKRQLAGFDQLEILSANDSSSGGGGGGSSGGGISYTDEEIDSGIVDFVAKLKELWENADYEGIGKIIADGINSAFERAKELISWDNLGAKITEVVNGITGIINGLVDGVNWTLIGETFGEGINTLVNTINLILTGINWEHIGQGFADGLNGLVDTVNWTNLGELFANSLNALISTIKGVVSGFSWGSTGEAFATTVNGLLSTVNWTDLAATATTSINGIIAALRIAINEFDWSYAATSFANTLNSLISGVDWDALANTATTSINKVIAALRIAINEFDWSYAATSFANTLNSLISGVDWDTLAETAGDSINKILSALRVAVNGFDWSYAATSFANTMNGLISKVDWDAIGKLASDSINKIFSALRVAVNGFDWSYAATSFDDTLNSLFKGVNWDELAKTAGDSLNKVIAALRTALNGFDWSYAGTSFANTVNTFFEKFDWDNLGKLVADGIAKPLSMLRTEVAGFDWKYAASSFAAAVNGFFSNEQLWADAGTIVSDAIKGLFTWGADFLDGIDYDQVAADLEAFVEDIDWPGVAKAIWKFLVAAFRGLGNLLGAILFDPTQWDDDAYTNWLQGIVDNSLRDLEWHFPAPAEIPVEVPPASVKKAVEDFITRWNKENPDVPVSPTASPGSVPALAYQFVEEWNELHPEAPITLNLPDDAGAKVKGLWDKQNPNLKSNVDPALPSDAGAKVKGLWDKQKPDLNADVKAKLSSSLAEGSATLASLFGTVLAVSGKLLPDAAEGSSTLGGVFGTVLAAAAKLSSKAANGSKSLIDVFGASFDTHSNLKGRVKDSYKLTDVYGDVDTHSNLKDRVKGSKKLKDVYGEKFSTKSDLTGKAKGSKSLTDVFGKTFTVTATLSSTISGLSDFVKTVANKLKEALQKIWDSFSGKANGGIITNSGKEIPFAAGGVIRGGTARYLSNVPHYAGGTTRAHGTVFVAGENGPEIMGHINGRTEILNKSQLADAIYSAVVSGMGRAVSALGTFLAGQMADCTNAITATIGNVAAIRGLEYRTPVMASGSVLPYEVAAQVARTGVDIQNTLDANNEDLIQTIISVAGQIVAAVQMSGQNRQQGGAGRGLTAQQFIDDINRRAQMFGASPLLE